VAHRPLTGVLLVGGASRRFGGPKALARLAGETLADRVWRVLQSACDECLAVGKADAPPLPFDVIDDGADVRAPIAGVLAGLRAASNPVSVFLPVDCPLVTEDIVRTLGYACRDAAVPSSGPLPGAWATSALPVLERRFAEGRLSLIGAYEELDVARPAIDESLLVDADTPDDLAAIAFQLRAADPRRRQTRAAAQAESDEHALARGADAYELDDHLELALDELDVSSRRVREIDE
jgi:molybdopterin-guanine dinucleotide biosynthesis protein A